MRAAFWAGYGLGFIVGFANRKYAQTPVVETVEADDPHNVYTSDGTLAYRFGDLD